MSLVPYNSPEYDNVAIDLTQELAAVKQRDERLAKLRHDQESHHHKQIWTKDAHGGPYEKVICKAGLDPLSASIQRAMVLGNNIARKPRPGEAAHFMSFRLNSSNSKSDTYRF